MLNMKTPGKAFTQRFATLQVFIPADNLPVESRPRCAGIFCGTGVRVTPAEMEQRDPRVDVFWQRNAWVDRPT